VWHSARVSSRGCLAGALDVSGQSSQFCFILHHLSTTTMAKGDDSTPPSSQSKKKRTEDEPMLEDASSKPLQLQRRRVWRACESCRYVHPHPHRGRNNSAFSHYFTYIGARRLNAMDVNLRVRNAPCQGLNALGCRRKIVQRSADSTSRSFL